MVIPIMQRGEEVGDGAQDCWALSVARDMVIGSTLAEPEWGHQRAKQGRPTCYHGEMVGVGIAGGW